MGLNVQIIAVTFESLDCFHAHVLHGTTKHDGVPDLKREDGPHHTLFTSVMGGISGLWVFLHPAFLKFVSFLCTPRWVGVEQVERREQLSPVDVSPLIPHPLMYFSSTFFFLRFLFALRLHQIL